MTGLTYVYQSYRFLGHCFDAVYLRHRGMEQLTASTVAIAHILVTINFILCMIVAYFLDRSLWLLITAAWIYTMGFSNYLFLFWGTFETKSYDMHVNPVLNFEAGWKIYQFYTLYPVIITLLIPILLLFVTQSITGLSYTIPLLSIGIAGLLGSKYWLKMIVHNLYRRKYNMLEGFRST